MAACSGGAVKVSATPSPSLESGWRPYSVNAEGFGIAVPPTWGRIDLNLSPTELATAFKDYPAFTKFVQQQQLNTYIKFFAVDHQTLASGLATNVNVVDVPVGDTVTSLDQVVADEAASFSRLQISPVKKRVHVRAGDAEEFDYTLTVDTPSGAKVLTAVRQYLLLRVGKAEFVVTFGTPNGQASAYDVVFGKIANTFHYQ